MAQPVYGGGIYPVDPQIERALNSCNRLLIVLWSPTSRPTTTANRPASIANRRDMHIRLARLSRFHSCSSSFPKVIFLP